MWPCRIFNFSTEHLVPFRDRNLLLNSMWLSLHLINFLHLKHNRILNKWDLLHLYFHVSTSSRLFFKLPFHTVMAGWKPEYWQRWAIQNTEVARNVSPTGLFCLLTHLLFRLLYWVLLTLLTWYVWWMYNAIHMFKKYMVMVPKYTCACKVPAG